MVPLRQRDILADPRLNGVDDAPQITSADVALNDHPALDVFAHHEVRAAILLNGRDGGQRNLPPIRRLDLCRPDGLQVC